MYRSSHRAGCVSEMVYDICDQKFCAITFVKANGLMSVSVLSLQRVYQLSDTYNLVASSIYIINYTYPLQV